MSTTPISPDLLRRLTSSRWLVPVLAQMHGRPGSRFSVLLRSLEIGRSMLAATLDTLEVEGWIARNPGHGHPLRPEYLLIASGRDAAAWCASTLEHLDTGALRRWSLPALQAISQGTDRFGDLAEKLAPITPRSLTMALENLADLKHVERSAEPSRHPRYRLTLRGKRLSGKLGLADNRRASC